MRKVGGLTVVWKESNPTCLLELFSNFNGVDGGEAFSTWNEEGSLPFEQVVIECRSMFGKMMLLLSLKSLTRADTLL